jgi:dipeptidyl aminopeptidase/acylaminoacyl peptidase
VFFFTVDLDLVVPKGQAEAIYNSIKQPGGVVEYKLYSGEGHGWRKEENMRDAIENWHFMKEL